MNRRRLGKPQLSAGVLLACLIIGLLFSGGLSQYNQYVATTLVLYAVIAQSYNIVAGYSGQLSLGVGAFIGIGGYAGGLLLVHTGVGWVLATLIATALCTVFAFVLGFGLLRLRGVYFAVGTLAAAVALGAAAQLWTFSGGGTGFVIAATPSSTALLRFGVIAFVLATAIVVFIRDSPFGLRMVATRDNEQAAAGVGISVFRYRMAAVVLWGALTGLAGALIAIQSISVAPGAMFSINWTIYATLFVVVGGRSTVIGPILGVLVVYYGLTHELQNLQAVSTIIEGVLLVAVMRFAPMGLWPLALRGVARLQKSLRLRLAPQLKTPPAHADVQIGGADDV